MDRFSKESRALAADTEKHSGKPNPAGKAGKERADFGQGAEKKKQRNDCHSPNIFIQIFSAPSSKFTAFQ